MREALFEVRNLRKHFRLGSALTIPALAGISFAIRRGEILGLVGESGSGKSTLARVMMGMEPPTAGEIYYKGREIANAPLDKQCRRALQINRQIIFQDSDAALNPRLTVAEIIAEPLRIHRGASDIAARVDSLLTQVGLDAAYRRRYPGEISGGQRQRVNIARAIALEPELIIADEPIASLDVSMQAQIVNLFQDLQREKNFSFLFIAHDLSMVRFISERVGVLCRGRLVELAAAEELFAHPAHPYTRALLASILRPDPAYEKRRTVFALDDDYVPPDGAWREISPEHFVLVEQPARR